ncbi:MAG: alpha/beta hydrolase [Elainellaceae cyanobacterium]
MQPIHADLINRFTLGQIYGAGLGLRPKSSSKPSRLRNAAHRRALQIISSVLVAVAGSFVPDPPTAIAAERLRVRLGPIEQSVNIEDLERFAHNGAVSPTLALYQPLLRDEVRLALTTSVPLNPSASETLMEDLLHSASGHQLMDGLLTVLPDSTSQEIETAFLQTIQDTQGISLLTFLKTYPDRDITVNVTAAIALASQLNLPHWQRHTLNSLLEQELTTEAPALPIPFDPSQPGHARVRQQSLTFRDRDRSRSIPVDLYWSRQHHGPLVVISHGFGADRRFLSYLAQHLASHGLTVAALEHPGSNVTWLSQAALGKLGEGGINDLLPVQEFIERPKDVSFLLDELSRLNRYSTILHRQINTKQVTVIGHSLGGYTALALAGATLDVGGLAEFCQGRSLFGLSPADWLQCSAVDLTEVPAIRDGRVTQVIAMNPLMGRIFGETGLSQVKVPTLIFSASEDPITPAVSQQLLPYTTLQTDSRYLVAAIGATHLSMGDPRNLNYALAQNSFLRERRWNETEPLRDLVRGLSLAFTKQQTTEANLYKPFLSAGYIQSWSNNRIRTRLVQDLPPKLETWLRMGAVPFEQVVASTIAKPRKPKYRHASTLEHLSKSLPVLLVFPPSFLPLGLLQFWRRRPPEDQE